MAEQNYVVVEHNGGFAYKVGDVYSETFPTHAAAKAAADDAAQRQQMSGEDTDIAYQDADGSWHNESESGEDRPETDVVDRVPDADEPVDAEGRPLDAEDFPDPDRAPIDTVNKTFRH